MTATVTPDWVFANAEKPAPTLREKGWASFKKLAVRAQLAVDAFERKRLDPLLDRALVAWGDRRQAQRQALGNTPLIETLTAEEQQLNHRLYLSAGSLGIAVVGRLFYPPLLLLSLPGLAYGAVQLYAQAYTTLVNERKLDVNVLAAIVNTAYIGGGYWVLGNLTNTSYFLSAKLLRDVKAQLQADLISTLAQHPHLVWTVVNGQELQRRLDALQVGDVVVVHGGEIVPIDGVICEGIATVDEQMLTGEARPVEKGVGDPIYSATLLLSGKLFITLQRAGAETLVARIGEVLAQTVDFHSTRQLHVQKLTDRLVPPILGLAALTAPFLGVNAAAAVVDSHPNRQLNIYGSLGVLNAFVRAAEQGVLIKDGRSLELLRQVDTLIFDKTGTLTQEEPVVAAIYCADEIGEAQLLAYAAAAEQHQSHPIARAILAAARARGVATPQIEEASLKVGLGLTVKSADQRILVGSTRFMALHAIPIPEQFAALEEKSQQLGHLLVWVARNDSMVGAVELQVALRAEAVAVVTALRGYSQIRTVLVVSGDQPLPTEQAALAIGADGWYAETLPMQKAELVARLQEAGRKVCFVGDGINDTIALKQADVSISLRGATSAAVDSANVLLMDANLSQLPALFGLAQSFEASQRLLMVPVLGASALGLVGIYLWGWGLAATTILGQISLIGGASVTLKQRLLPEKGA